MAGDRTVTLPATAPLAEFIGNGLNEAGLPITARRTVAEVQQQFLDAGPLADVINALLLAAGLDGGNVSGLAASILSTIRGGVGDDRDTLAKLSTALNALVGGAAPDRDTLGKLSNVLTAVGNSLTGEINRATGRQDTLDELTLFSRSSLVDSGPDGTLAHNGTNVSVPVYTAARPNSFAMAFVAGRMGVAYNRIDDLTRNTQTTASVLPRSAPNGKFYCIGSGVGFSGVGSADIAWAAIYPRCLTDAEIATIYAKVKAQLAAKAQPLAI